MAIRPIKIDFTNVKDAAQFRPKHIEPGEYAGRVKSVEEKKSRQGDPQWVFTITLDDVPSATYPFYIGLDFSGEKSQAWKVRQIATACGLTIPKKAVSVNPERLVGKRLGVEIEEDEYQGRMKGNIARLLPLSEIVGNDEEPEDEDEDEEEEAPPAPKRRRKPAPEPEEEEDDEEDEEEEPAPRRKAAPAKKAAPRRQPAPVEEEEDEEDELDLDEI